MRDPGLAGDRRTWRTGRLVVLLMIVMLVMVELMPRSAWAQTGSTVSDAGLGVASFIATIPYGALKIAYAGLGAIVGGFTYLLTGGDIKAAEVVWTRSLGGTYVLTPEHLVGNQPIRFIGP